MKLFMMSMKIPRENTKKKKKENTTKIPRKYPEKYHENTAKMPRENTTKIPREINFQSNLVLVVRHGI